MGKFLNGYLESPRARGPTVRPPRTCPPTYVPPGWTRLGRLPGWGYPEFNYWLNQNGVLRWYGHQPTDYLTDVTRARATSIDQAAQARESRSFSSWPRSRRTPR